MENVVIRQRVMKIALEKGGSSAELAKVLNIGEAVLKHYFENVETGALPDALFMQLLDFIDPM
jgi:hypothetical protein